ncbi:hypothetical protein [Limnohabitans sp.]|jgi:hypothetical protein|uniref:hypothetical protein n=1 Tax=Limnohabitans sp. TaxID=1907725 RepID=UPI0037C1620F
MTEAGWVTLRGWCDKRGGFAAAGLPDAVTAGKGVISTLKAEGGTWAWRSVFSTAGGNRVFSGRTDLAFWSGSGKPGVWAIEFVVLVQANAAKRLVNTVVSKGVRARVRVMR